MILSKSNIESVDLEQIQLDYVLNGNADKLLLIVPTNRKLRQVKKQIIKNSPQSSTSGAFVETLSTLSEKLLKQSENFSQLSEAASAVFIAQSAENSKLRYFSKYSSAIPFGTLDRIKNAIYEYKRLGITPGKLRQLAENLEFTEKNKALDIADIYERFKLRCSRVSAMELGDMYEALNKLNNDEWNNSFRKIFPNVEIVIVTGFDEFSTPEINILDSVSQIGGINMFINFDYFARNRAIFGHLENCYKQLENRNFRRIKDSSQPGNSFLFGMIRENLFKYSYSGSKFDGNINLMSAPRREKEVENIARMIKLLILKEGARPRDICVAFNSIVNYSPLIRSIFPMYGIPVNLTDRTKLANSQPIITVINLLEILENDFYYKNIVRVLNSPFVQFEQSDVSRFIRIASKLKVTSGLNTWRKKLNANISLIESFGTDRLEKNISLVELQSVNSLLSSLEELLKPFDKLMTPGEFLGNLNLTIQKLKITELLLRHGGDNQEANIKAFTLFLETLGEIMELTERENPNLREPLGFYLDQVKTACGWARFNVKEKSDFGVLVTSVNEIRGLQFDHLFVGGMIDGEFPLNYTPEFFLSGEHRKSEDIRQTEERFHFYQVLSAWRKGLYFTYPKVVNKHENSGSLFLTELEKIVNLKQIPEDFFDGYLLNNKELLLADDPKLSEEIFGVSLQNALEADKLRSANVWGDSEFSGYLGNSGDDIRESLEKFADREYSISQLETFAACPFRFFIERVLKIEVDEEPSEEYDQAEVGLILHAILYEFYTKLSEKNITLQNCSDEVFDFASELIFGIAEEIFELSETDYPLAFLVKERILGFDGNRSDSILFKFLENERKMDDFRPAYFESAFGSAANYKTVARISSPQPIEFEGVKLKGKIDRIEMNDDNNTFSVVDYKSGLGKVKAENLKEGTSLQLPVYLYAAEKLLQNIYGDKYHPAAAFIYSLKYSSRDFGKKFINLGGRRPKTVEEMQDAADEQIQISLSKIREYINNICEGNFQLTQLDDYEKDACRYCDFSSVCRVNELLK